MTRKRFLYRRTRRTPTATPTSSHYPYYSPFFYVLGGILCLAENNAKLPRVLFGDRSEEQDDVSQFIVAV